MEYQHLTKLRISALWLFKHLEQILILIQEHFQVNYTKAFYYFNRVCKIALSVVPFCLLLLHCSILS